MHSFLTVRAPLVITVALLAAACTKASPADAYGNFEAEEVVVAAETSGTSARQRAKKVEVLDFEIGDSIMVADGPFAGMHATITEINPKSARLKALVAFMGRETPLDLEFKQVEKVV